MSKQRISTSQRKLKREREPSPSHLRLIDDLKSMDLLLEVLDSENLELAMAFPPLSLNSLSHLNDSDPTSLFVDALFVENLELKIQIPAKRFRSYTQDVLTL